MRAIFSFSLLVGCSLLNSCNNPTPICQPELAWYHWKSSWENEAAISVFEDSLGTGKIYLRLFDVDRDESTGLPVPVGLLEGFAEGKTLDNVIPVVFITNRTLQNLTEGDAEMLAKRIVGLVNNYLPAPSELQLDCDWTESTRAVFFRLVESVKKYVPHTKLSVTIRLHQFKYPDQTGVPPADRGMLMVYNMGDVESWETENSILDPAIASQYLNNAGGYPLSLDIALPLFQWGCTYRDGHLVQLFHNLSEEDLVDTARFQLLSGNRYSVRQNTFLNGFYLNKNDRIRLEEVSIKDLKEVSKMLAPFADCCNSTVAFYHLDSSILKKYKPGELKEIVKLMCE